MKTVLAVWLLAVLVMSITISSNFSYAKQTKADAKAEKTIKKKLDQFTGKNQQYTKICALTATTTKNSTLQLVYEKNCNVLPPQCESGFHLENGICVPDIPPPPPCKSGFHLENGICVPDKITCRSGFHLENGICVPDIPPTTCAIGLANKSQYVRLGVVADTDPAKSGQKEQFQQMKDCGVDILVNNGDVCYSDCATKLFSMIEPLGFTKTNTQIACGNHDQCSEINKWLGTTKNWNIKSFVDGKIDIIAMDENSKTCGTTQWNDVKGWIENSKSQYKIVTLHQMSHSVPSTHSETGDASCQDSVFLNNKLDLLLQGHNHNYQRFLISDNLGHSFTATVGPPGLHDSGNSLYPLNGKSDSKGDPCLKCLRDNGVMLIDLRIDGTYEVSGKVVNAKNQVIDSFRN